MNEKQIIERYGTNVLDMFYESEKRLKDEEAFQKKRNKDFEEENELIETLQKQAHKEASESFGEIFRELSQFYRKKNLSDERDYLLVGKNIITEAINEFYELQTRIKREVQKYYN